MRQNSRHPEQALRDGETATKHQYDDKQHCYSPVCDDDVLEAERPSSAAAAASRNLWPWQTADGCRGRLQSLVRRDVYQKWHKEQHKSIADYQKLK